MVDSKDRLKVELKGKMMVALLVVHLEQSWDKTQVDLRVEMLVEMMDMRKVAGRVDLMELGKVVTMGAQKDLRWADQ